MEANPPSLKVVATYMLQNIYQVSSFYLNYYPTKQRTNGCSKLRNSYYTYLKKQIGAFLAQNTRRKLEVKYKKFTWMRITFFSPRKRNQEDDLHQDTGTQQSTKSPVERKAKMTQSWRPSLSPGQSQQGPRSMYSTVRMGCVSCRRWVREAHISSFRQGKRKANGICKKNITRKPQSRYEAN